MFFRHHIKFSETSNVISEYNFWVTWPVSKILTRLYLCFFNINWTLEQLSRSPSFCRQFGTFIWHHDNLSKSFKIKELIISEFRYQSCSGYSGTFIYTLPLKIFPEVHHFFWEFEVFLWHHVKRSETSQAQEIIISDSRDQCPRCSQRSSDMKPTWEKTSKIKQPVISESSDQCSRNLGTFIYSILALASV